MINDSTRDQWVESTLPKETEFSRGFVAHLMKQAYEEGKKNLLRGLEEEKLERIHGPRFI